jgi:hypothetical protein
MKKLKLNKSNIFIGVLIVVAIGLGIAIYVQRNPSVFEKQASSEVEVPQPTATLKDFRPLRTLPKDLTADERSILQAPQADDPVSKKEAHFQIVNKLAQEADVLNINKCEKPSPLVLSLKYGQEFKVKNDDSIPHSIIIDKNHIYKIDANSTVSFKADFGRGLGAYGYLCEKYAGIVGFFLVEK